MKRRNLRLILIMLLLGILLISGCVEIKEKLEKQSILDNSKVDKSVKEKISSIKDPSEPFKVGVKFVNEGTTAFNKLWYEVIKKNEILNIKTDMWDYAIILTNLTNLNEVLELSYVEQITTPIDAWCIKNSCNEINYFIEKVNEGEVEGILYFELWFKDNVSETDILKLNKYGDIKKFDAENIFGNYKRHALIEFDPTKDFNEFLSEGIIEYIELQSIKKLKINIQLNETELKYCEEDSDCIRVLTSCCDCNNWGDATTINERYGDEWQEYMKVRCIGTGICPTAGSLTPGCNNPIGCINNKCSILEKESFQDDTNDSYEEKPSSSYDLSNYPTNFLINGEFNGLFVAGDNARNDDILGMSRIMSSVNLSIIGKEGGISGLAKLANEIEDITSQNMILIGGPCANNITAQIMKLPTTWPECATGFESGVGRIILYNKWNKTQLVVAGFSAEDTRKAAYPLLRYNKFNLTGNEIEVTGDIGSQKIERIVIEMEKYCEEDSDCILVISGCRYCPSCKDYKITDPEVIVVNKNVYKCPPRPKDLVCIACVDSIDYNPYEDTVCINNECEKKRTFAQISTDKIKANVNEEIQLTIIVFPSKMKICDPYLTILYETTQTKESKPKLSSTYYIDYRGDKVYIGENWDVFEPKQYHIGCREDIEFTLTRTIKFEKKGSYIVEAHVNSLATRNSLTIMIENQSQEQYVCPEQKTIDCMPSIPPEMSIYCIGPYHKWVKENCDVSFTY